MGALVKPKRQIPLKLRFWYLRLANRAVTLRVNSLRSTANHLEQMFTADDNYELVKMLISQLIQLDLQLSSIRIFDLRLFDSCVTIFLSTSHSVTQNFRR